MIHLLLFLLLLVVYYVVSFYRKVRQYPPGPTPLPFIGNLHQIDLFHIHLEYTEFSKKYGPVFTVWLPKPYVVVADYENLKEAFGKNDDVSGRNSVFPDTAFQLVPNQGIIASEGLNWKEQRRTSLHILRDFGMGKNIMENMVIHSAEECIKHLKASNPEKGIDMRWPLQLFVGNIITEILFGWRYKYEDCDELKKFAIITWEQFDQVKQTPSFIFFIGSTFPKLLTMPGIKNLLVGHVIRKTREAFEMIEMFIDRCRKGYDPSHEPECFVQAYVQKLGSNEYHNEEQLRHVCNDFYLAGMETTTTTLRWSMLYLAKYQDVQAKIRQEIDNILGGNKKPSMSDKTRMPYTSAVINEIQRHTSLAPVGVNHKSMKEVAIGGYTIPEQTIVTPLLYNVLFNSSVFENGEEFLPERFLLKDGVSLNKEAVERCIPFGVGKRICAGEGLARVELFIGLVTILQNFQILPEPGKDIDLTKIVTAVLAPKDQNVRLVPV